MKRKLDIKFADYRFRYCKKNNIFILNLLFIRNVNNQNYLSLCLISILSFEQ